MMKSYDETRGLGADPGSEAFLTSPLNRNDNNTSRSAPSDSLGSKNRKLDKSLPYHTCPSSRQSFDTLSGLSTYSIAAVRSSARCSNLRLTELNARVSSNSPAPPRIWRGKWQQIWYENKGIVLMILAQFFGAAMATTARFLETSDERGEPMSTFQILFVRMGITMITSFLYMWWAKVPSAPFGPREVRWLLVVRGFGGFFGVFGLYYSLVFLPLAEATVITFLAPMIAAWACSLLIKSPFTRIHQIAGMISICGVILIAQPFSIAQVSTKDSTPSFNGSNISTSEISGVAQSASSQHAVTAGEHTFAVFVGLVGVCGAACAYTTITWIGKRAHPLISVNYFATWCAAVSIVALLTLPGATFRLPSGLREWMLMALLGISGFVMQFLLTAALSHERDRCSSAGLNMVYTQMLFALAMDKLVWGTSPGVLSIVGSSLILGSAVWVAIRNEDGGKKKGAQSTRAADVVRNDEEWQALVDGMEVDNEDGIGEGRASLDDDVIRSARDARASESRNVESNPLNPGVGDDQGPSGRWNPRHTQLKADG